MFEIALMTMVYFFYVLPLYSGDRCRNVSRKKNGVWFPQKAVGPEYGGLGFPRRDPELRYRPTSSSGRKTLKKKTLRDWCLGIVGSQLRANLKPP